MHLQDQLRDACCHLANMIENIDKTDVCYAGCQYETSDVAFCQITLATRIGYAVHSAESAVRPSVCIARLLVLSVMVVTVDHSAVTAVVEVSLNDASLTTSCRQARCTLCETSALTVQCRVNSP